MTAASAEFLLPPIEAFETFPSDWKERMIVKIPKQESRMEYENWRYICVVSTITKIIPKIILECTKGHLESLFDREQALFGSFAEFRSPFHLSFIDFKKAFVSVKRECTRNASHSGYTTISSYYVLHR